MSDTVIQVENLAKRYVIEHQKKGSDNYKTLRGAMTNAAKSVASALNPRAKREVGSSREEFWALKDVSFEVKQGDRVGIIGRNGAGKSTLLKILSRITEPTKGAIRINGRVASLLEVGTGFHPELTGRENVFLNGAILGMSRAEIQRKFDEMVAFAEVEKFLDTPVKRYSSGMYVRLAFAVAAHLEPEILIVDEVLAVGDSAFQKKCLGKMGQVAKEGRTVIFVSHNMAAIRSLCSGAVVLNKGRVALVGTTAECIAIYEAHNIQNQGDVWVRSVESKEDSLVITEIRSALKGEQPNLELDLEISLESRAKHKPAFIAADILDSTGTTIMQALPTVEGFLADQKPQYPVRFLIQLPPLIPGQYFASIWVGSHNTETLDFVGEAIMFEVHESPTIGRSFPHSPEHGYIVPISTIKY
ncbi:MAG: ABC transporter ATP-binding protein [Stigonema ocellatum SAG 48.90 = DSM 106950]|nr:ABC transporter ATP-binding protein [Stigonema ocellatum SAG 48.90 = DSM 106950]